MGKGGGPRGTGAVVLGLFVSIVLFGDERVVLSMTPPDRCVSHIRGA